MNSWANSVKQTTKRLVIGTPVEEAARQFTNRWNVAREPKRTMDSILRYTRPVPRYGEGKPPHPELAQIIGARRDSYEELLRTFSEYSEYLAKIPAEPTADPAEPYWNNGWLPGLDAIGLYCMLAMTNPEVYFEVGSGNSTRFARKSITDHGLRTKIISVDPQPRADCNALCDKVIRRRLETVKVSKVLDMLAPGAIVFLDGSHRSFMNSDATVFFLEVMPRLPAGALVHIHDIYLPDDYPKTWANRYYTEQYLLASWLLGGSAGYRVHCPNHFIKQDDDLRELVLSGFSDLRLAVGDPIGPASSFWLEKTHED
jgi:hypothetical protein